jgi:hypothetical protein
VRLAQAQLAVQRAALRAARLVKAARQPAARQVARLVRPAVQRAARLVLAARQPVAQLAVRLVRLAARLVRPVAQLVQPVAQLVLASVASAVSAASRTDASTVAKRPPRISEAGVFYFRPVTAAPEIVTAKTRSLK